MYRNNNDNRTDTITVKIANNHQQIDSEWTLALAKSIEPNTALLEIPHQASKTLPLENKAALYIKTDLCPEHEGNIIESYVKWAHKQEKKVIFCVKFNQKSISEKHFSQIKKISEKHIFL